MLMAGVRSCRAWVAATVSPVSRARRAAKRPCRLAEYQWSLMVDALTASPIATGAPLARSQQDACAAAGFAISPGSASALARHRPAALLPGLFITHGMLYIPAGTGDSRSPETPHGSGADGLASCGADSGGSTPRRSDAAGTTTSLTLNRPVSPPTMDADLVIDVEQPAIRHRGEDIPARRLEIVLHIKSAATFTPSSPSSDGDHAAADDTHLAQGVVDGLAGAAVGSVTDGEFAAGHPGDSNLCISGVSSQQRPGSFGEGCFPEKKTTVAAGKTPGAASPLAEVEGCIKDPAVVCFLEQRVLPDDTASDPMLIEWGTSWLAPAPRLILPLPGQDHPVLFATAGSADQTSQAEMPSQPASPREASSAGKRLDQFIGEIQKRISTPLAQKPTRPKLVAPVATEASKRSSSRLANNKLAKIPAARRGEVLLMRRFDLVADGATKGELNGVFGGGLSGGDADKVLDFFPSRRTATNRR